MSGRVVDLSFGSSDGTVITSVVGVAVPSSRVSAADALGVFRNGAARRGLSMKWAGTRCFLPVAFE